MLTRRFKALFCLTLCTALSLPAVVHAQSSNQSFKVGYVSVERIVRESVPAKAAAAQISTEFSKRQAEIEQAQARFKSAYDALEKDGPVLAEAERYRRQKDLSDLEREVQRLRRTYNDDLTARQNEEMAHVIDQANAVVRQIAQAQNYDLIVQDAVYISPRVDITDQVLKQLSSTH